MPMAKTIGNGGSKKHETVVDKPSDSKTLLSIAHSLCDNKILYSYNSTRK